MPIMKPRFNREFRKAFPVTRGKTVPIPNKPMTTIKNFVVPLVGGEYTVSSLKAVIGEGVLVAVYSERRRQIHRFLLDSKLNVSNHSVEEVGQRSLNIPGGADPRVYEGDT